MMAQRMTAWAGRPKLMPPTETPSAVIPSEVRATTIEGLTLQTNERDQSSLSEILHSVQDDSRKSLRLAVWTSVACKASRSRQSQARASRRLAISLEGALLSRGWRV